LNIVKKYIDDLKPDEELTNSTTLVFIVDRIFEQELAEIVELIERNLESLNLKTFDVREISLQDIFYSINAKNVPGYAGLETAEEIIKEYIEMKTVNVFDKIDYKLLEGSALFWQRLYVFWKIGALRFINPRRYLLIFILVPILFCNIAYLMGEKFLNDVRNGRRPLNASVYPDPTFIIAFPIKEDIYRLDRHIVSNTFWYYRENLYNNHFKLINTDGMSVYDYMFFGRTLIDDPKKLEKLVGGFSLYHGKSNNTYSIYGDPDDDDYDEYYDVNNYYFQSQQILEEMENMVCFYSHLALHSLPTSTLMVQEAYIQ